MAKDELLSPTMTTISNPNPFCIHCLHNPLPLSQLIPKRSVQRIESKTTDQQCSGTPFIGAANLGIASWSHLLGLAAAPTTTTTIPRTCSTTTTIPWEATGAYFPHAAATTTSKNVSATNEIQTVRGGQKAEQGQGWWSADGHCGGSIEAGRSVCSQRQNATQPPQPQEQEE